MAVYVDLLEELPLLVFADDQTLGSVIEILGSLRCSDPLSVDVRRLAESARLRKLAEALAESSIVNNPEAAELSLHELIPGLLRATGCVDVGDVPQRLYNLLGRHDALDYPSFARLHLSDLLYRWQGVGIKSVQAVLMHAIDVGLQFRLGSEEATAMRESAPLSRPSPCPADYIPAADDVSPASDGPGMSVGLELCGAYRPSEAEIAGAFESLVSSLPERYPEIAQSRLFALGKKPTLELLGQRMGVTRERIRQLERKAEERVLWEVDRRAHAALRIEANSLRTQLGAAYRMDRLRELLSYTLEAGARGDSTGNPGLLLLWLAGPYRLCGDWLVREEHGDSLEEQTLSVIEACMLSGVGQTATILAALGDLDIREPMQLHWLEHQKGYRILDQCVVMWGSSMSSKAAAVLRCRNEPMTAAEIAPLIGDRVNPRSLKNQLMDDPCIKRVGKLHFGLSDWEHDEYTTVSDEIAEEIERQGGEATLAHLIEVISTTYGVTESSIRAYSATRRFVRTKSGTIRVANADEISADTRPIHLSKGCYLLNGAWSVRVRVTSETLRGSGTSVPDCFIAQFGIRPGQGREVASPFGPVNVSWGYMSAYLGSLRSTAEALMAIEGDLLFVKAMSPDRLEFELIRESELGDLSTPSHIAALVGWGGLGPSSDPLVAVSHAIGFDEPAGTDALSAATRIRARHELELLPIVEEDSSGAVGESAVAEILDLLGCEPKADTDGG